MVLLVALLLLGSYGGRVFARDLACDCDRGNSLVAVSFAVATGDNAGAGGGGQQKSEDHSDHGACLCLCHQSAAATQCLHGFEFGSIGLPEAVTYNEWMNVLEDADRPGIDHPPQLA